jgi:spore coat polysaccharide biosynthesis protein SpsF (cytidylyltransferase family)
MKKLTKLYKLNKHKIIFKNYFRIIIIHIEIHNKLFNILYLVPQKKHQLPHLRFTLDYNEDYIFIKKIFEEIHGVIDLDKIIELTARDLPWVKAFNDFRKAMDL